MVKNGLYIDFFGHKFWYNLPTLCSSDLLDISDIRWWHNNGMKHRVNGPAVDLPDGSKFWYYQGEKIECETQEEFERLIKLKILW